LHAKTTVKPSKIKGQNIVSSEDLDINVVSNHKNQGINLKYGTPLVNVYIAMDNPHFSQINLLFLWSFSIAMLNYQ